MRLDGGWSSPLPSDLSASMVIVEVGNWFKWDRNLETTFCLDGDLNPNFCNSPAC